MSHDYACALQGEACHDHCNDHVGPAGSRAEHTERRQQYGEIPKNVVARANPRGMHVGITATVAPQKTERDAIGRERRRSTDRGHCCDRKLELFQTQRSPAMPVSQLITASLSTRPVRHRTTRFTPQEMSPTSRMV